MKTRIAFFFAAFIFLVSQLGAQQAQVDSLIRIINAAQQDSVKLNIYMKVCEICDTKDNLKYGNAAYSISDRLIKQAKTLAEKEKFIEKKIFAYDIIAIYYEEELDNSDSVKNYRVKSVELAKTTSNKDLINTVTDRLAEMYRRKNQFTQAMSIYRTALVEAEKKGDKDAIIFNIQGIGSTYMRLHNPQKALEYRLKELEIQEKSGDKWAIAWTNIAVGQAYFQLSAYKTAIEYQLKGERYLIDKVKPKEKIYLYFNLARPYNDLGNAKKAREYFMQALEINKGMHDYPGDSIVRGVFHSEIGQTYFIEKDYKKAIEYKLKGINFIANKSDGDAFQPYFTTAEVYLAMQEYELAENNIMCAQKIAEKRNDFLNQKEVAKLLAKIYKGKCNTTKANEFLIHYYELKDSVDKAANADELMYKEFNYENEKKELQLKAEQEKQTEAYNEEKRKQRNIIYSVSSGLILIAGFAFFVATSLRKSRKANKIIEQQKAEVEKQKHLVEEKQKEIIDSIRYARRIQTSLLPTEKYIDKSITRLKE